MVNDEILSGIKRVLITGSTGFVGSRLCEVMMRTGVFEPRAFIHSTASARRITRFPVDFVIGDICNQSDVKCAIRGCDAVIHLTRNGRRVMKKGLKNVLIAAKEEGVSRFVHVSSVAVYGNTPPPESVFEETPARKPDNDYGKVKLLQENLALRYHSKYKLPIVILRPPNIYGPYAWFTVNLMEKILLEEMAIVDGGQNPCNLVYIDNLIEAIILALWKKEAVGQTFFVTDNETVTWEKVIKDYAKLLGREIPFIDEKDLIPERRERVLIDSLLTLPKVFLSNEFRQTIAKVPIFKRLLAFPYAIFQSMFDEAQKTIRFYVQGPTVFSQNKTHKTVFSQADNIIGAQKRTVAHSNDKAKRILGYKAAVSYSEGMQLTTQWLQYARQI